VLCTTSVSISDEADSPAAGEELEVRPMLVHGKCSKFAFIYTEIVYVTSQYMLKVSIVVSLALQVWEIT